MKMLAATVAMIAGLLFLPRTFGVAPVYLAQSETFEVSNQSGDDTNNEMTPPEVSDTNA